MEWLRNPIDQTNPLKPVWTFDQIPDLSGKVIIVTGGNAEIGKESVQALLAHNATVYVASRSEEHAQSAIAELKEATGKEPIFLRLDLGNLSHIRKAAEEFLSKEKQLRVLMNNAGVMYPPTDQVTDGNFYMPFGTNVIAPEAANLNGQYLKPWARLGKAVPSTQDPEVAAKLRAWLEAAVAGK
ncbi:NAD(P)-binding protein [Pleurotus eryngii]|uniref:NAD(P)-binding protein n=1 Tax=Pleurotus eryngii TaxID=5323 RepID=A0A9P6D9H8_PLEER|nr:NAD(P)-binding protein [Pleurotus eryngii]